jgi:hypothetical protein
VLGSGLGPIADEVQEPAVIPYAEVPHFHAPAVQGHPGRLVIGRLAGVPALVLQVCSAGRVCVLRISVARVVSSTVGGSQRARVSARLQRQALHTPPPPPLAHRAGSTTMRATPWRR